MPSKILITGGCGFVGAAVCRRLLAAHSGLSITVLDSLRRAGAETNREQLAAVGVTVVHGDIRLATAAYNAGPGAVSRFHIGLVIATGLGIGTIFTLFIVPAFYLVLAREHAAEEVPDQVSPELESLA